MLGGRKGESGWCVGWGVEFEMGEGGREVGHKEESVYRGVMP